MAHISSIGASKFTTLDYVLNTANSDASTAAALNDLFISNQTAILATDAALDETPESAVVHVGNIREFPSLGSPANIVNVPVYGASVSSQVSGQSDNASLEFSLNYIPSDHHSLDAIRKAGSRLCFRVRLADADITVSASRIVTADNADTFADFFFFGKIASFEIQPGLTDALQATMSLSIEGGFNGPFSLVAGVSSSTYALPA